MSRVTGEHGSTSAEEERLARANRIIAAAHGQLIGARHKDFVLEHSTAKGDSQRFAIDDTPNRLLFENTVTIQLLPDAIDQRTAHISGLSLLFITKPWAETPEKTRDTFLAQLNAMAPDLMSQYVSLEAIDPPSNTILGSIVTASDTTHNFLFTPNGLSEIVNPAIDLEKTSHQDMQRGIYLQTSAMHDPQNIESSLGKELDDYLLEDLLGRYEPVTVDRTNPTISAA